MKARLYALISLALVIPLSLATTACKKNDRADGKAGSDRASNASRPSDPKQALAVSTDGLASGIFSFTIKDQTKEGSGTIHKPSSSAQIDVVNADAATGMRVTMNVRMIGKDIWVKLAFSEATMAKMFNMPNNKWLHVDPSKITKLDGLAVDFTKTESLDKAGAGKILKSIVKAQQDGDGKYSGTIDLSQVKDVNLIDSKLVTALADQAKAVPFTATVDDQGRLTSLTLQVPAAGSIAAHTIEITFSDYGTAAAPQPPAAGETQEAPVAVYQFLNS